MNQLRRGRVQGPLASFAVRFRQELADGGYAVRSAETHLLLMARLSRWLEQTSLDPGELGVARVEEFLRWNQAEGYRFPKSVRGAELLLGFLRGLGVIPGPPAPMLSAGEQLLARFRVYLGSERGLAPGTITNYVHAGRLLFQALPDRAGEFDLTTLSAARVNEVVVQHRRGRSIAPRRRTWSTACGASCGSCMSRGSLPSICRAPSRPWPAGAVAGCPEEWMPAR